LKKWIAGLCTTLFAATAFAADWAPLLNLPAAHSGLQITAPAVPRLPFTVAGEDGAIFGRQNGRFEAWLWPVKILSNFRIQAQLANYAVPIDVNALAAGIQVTPAETIITYSHSAFTIRQHMFASRGSQKSATGVVAYFELQSLRQLDVTFSFTPEMLRMWPAPNFGRPNAEWIPNGKSGFYVLHTDNPQFSAIVGMPGSQPGIMVPYQEHPQTYPVELKLSFDPKRDRGSLYPLVMGLTNTSAPADQAASLNTAIPQIYTHTQDYYAHFFDKRLTAKTPDSRLNEALQWAEIAVDQAQVRYHDEVGLVAGYYESADSARPGYAWFFGRDTLWTTYAINSYGDFALTREALDFLFRRQRADGKIMHEFSQSADSIDWPTTPYFYASADSTPLLVMALRDYVASSSDIAYLKAHWPAVQKAYAFTRLHEERNGIYSNAEGTGWVESWPGGMPKQEIYLAALDQQSSSAMSTLARLMGDQSLATTAQRKASEIEAKLESEFYEPDQKFYAFSRNEDASLDSTASIYPSVAWWDGTLVLPHAGPMLTRWASNEFSTDWGTVDISNQTSFFDPISYHQGTVWPLFTGWISLAEYRADRPMSAYAHLMQNAGLTWIQDLGSVTELLSGEFFQPLGRSSSHQLWSSAMVISPLLRGTFGISADAPNRTLRVAPQLPATWNHASLRNVALGSDLLDVEIDRQGPQLLVRATPHGSVAFCLGGDIIQTHCRPSSGVHTVTVSLNPVEIEIPTTLPVEGIETAQLKCLNQQISSHQALFTFAGPAGSSYDLPLRLNRGGITLRDAESSGGKLHVRFPAGTGYQTKSVTFIW
jgi:glycogen debranching enzyme